MARTDPGKRPEAKRNRAGSGAAALPRGLGGYADLLLALSSGGPAQMQAVAELLGYEFRPPREPPATAPAKRSAATARPAPATPPESAEPPPETLSFWYAESITTLKPILIADTAAAPAAEWPGLPRAQPAYTELTPWPALLPRLRTAATERVPGKAVDARAIVEHLQRAEFLGSIPRRPRRRWGRQLQIVREDADRLIPFEQDGRLVEQRITRLFPRRAWQRVIHFSGLDRLSVELDDLRLIDHTAPEPGTLFLVLGDLGCLAAEPERRAGRWLALGRRLRQLGCRPVALTPCPPSLWLPELARVWTMVPWDRDGGGQRLTRAERDIRAGRLLRLLSSAIRIEPGFLRDARLLLGPEASAVTEADVFQHDAMLGRSRIAGTIHPGEVANQLRLELTRNETPETRAALLGCLLRWRADLPPEIWYEEFLNLDPDTRALLPESVRSGSLQAARRFLGEHAGSDDGSSGVPGWYRRLYPRKSAAYHQWADAGLVAAQHRLYANAYREMPDPPPPPPGFDPRNLPPGVPRDIALCQSGDRLAIAGTVPNGSPLVTVYDASGHLSILPAGPEFWETGHPPSWADDWGRDQYGPRVTFSVAAPDGGRITQRMRWLPAGSFQMGSPETEDGRFDDEGPRHDVILAEGFWMFDTAVSEALWEAVTGTPPERRRGPQFPVTGVSWHDAQDFARRLNALKPGLAAGLPSEAQWEYACRAGTETPYSFGTRVTRDQVRFEADDPVSAGSLPANARGLYEMHGNVWEWCADQWHGDYEGAPADGSAWVDAQGSADRVLRGGSWGDDARGVRAAYRFGSDPAYRRGSIGFRCARVQVPGEAGGAERRAGRSKRGERSETAATTGPPRSRVAADPARPIDPAVPASGDASPAPGLIRPGGPESAALPPAGGLLVRTDLQEVHLARMVRPHWASAIGRDRFGLWSEFTIPGADAAQRLRWIPPGRFMMGSPEAEAGRFDWEGPRHAVTIGTGFWLFDTPCTQALWTAVMDGNPSRFQTPSRPVEQVSFDDVQTFLTRLNARVPGLALSLPSEAQWEYACRAGTTEATYAGDLHIAGDNNAPELDAIAWYGGNSGVDFDLDNGVDSSGWPGKQYDHTRAGTRPVKLKQPNAWGLHDMLGNVWEWCEDHWHDGYKEAPADGSAWTAARGSADRVLRGGSWAGDARYVRAAYRCGNVPASRSGSIGFRCARVQVPSEAGGAERRAGRSKRGERSETAATTGPPRSGSVTQ